MCLSYIFQWLLFLWQLFNLGLKVLMLFIYFSVRQNYFFAIKINMIFFFTAGYINAASTAHQPFAHGRTWRQLLAAFLNAGSILLNWIHNFSTWRLTVSMSSSLLMTTVSWWGSPSSRMASYKSAFPFVSNDTPKTA